MGNVDILCFGLSADQSSSQCRKQGRRARGEGGIVEVDRDFMGNRFVRRYEWRELEDGRVVVLRPRFGEGRLARRVAELFHVSDYWIRLDEIGTTVWQRCDGTTTGRQIAEELRAQFGDRVEPAEDRLQRFITQMLRARMIGLQSGEI